MPGCDGEVKLFGNRASLDLCYGWRGRVQTLVFSSVLVMASSELRISQYYEHRVVLYYAPKYAR